ncbi:hypothetical protein [Mesorhizobium tianshanense]|uniref:hypothetical protein n=1 Tax=Mesorhizobium tianshanense TaxID=39844 RepID=UPI0011A5AE87|nr:hypothetical protein [Mesorhizobium tianshanense]
MSNRKSRASALTANTQNDESIAGAFKRSPGAHVFPTLAVSLMSLALPALLQELQARGAMPSGSAAIRPLAAKLLSVSTCAAGVEIRLS